MNTKDRYFKKERTGSVILRLFEIAPTYWNGSDVMEVAVLQRVPQGVALGPVLFLLYFNDIMDGIRFATLNSSQLILWSNCQAVIMRTSILKSLRI